MNTQPIYQKQESKIIQFPVKNQQRKTTSDVLPLVAGSLFSLYIIGLVFPENWWGLHFLSYLPPAFAFGIPTIAGAMLLHSFYGSSDYTNFIKRLGRFDNWQIIFLAGSMSLFFYMFPIAEDVYGDAVHFKNFISEKPSKVSSNEIKDFFQFSFAPRAGEQTFIIGVKMISEISQLSYRDIFQLINVIFGFLYVLSWGYFLKRYFRRSLKKSLLLILALTAPFLLIFNGHLEIYAPVFVLMTGYFMSLLLYFKTKKKKYFFILFPLFLLNLKLHTIALLLIPSLALTTLYHLYQKQNWFTKIFNWQYLSRGLLLPIFLLGAYMYFFVFQSHVDNRLIDATLGSHEHLFLPIISPEAPLDKYNLFGFNHLFDSLNQIFLWSSAAVFLFIAFLVKFRKKIQWNKPEVLLLGISLILFTSLLFVTNPLVGMPMDWDLFSIPAPIFILFLAAMMKYIPTPEINQKIVGPCMAFSLLCLPVFYVNASPEALSHRLEDTGKYLFKTYWIDSHTPLSAGINMVEEDKEAYLNRRTEAIEELEPYALPGKDRVFSNLVMQVGIFYVENGGNYSEALPWFQKAYQYASDYPVNLLYLTETCFSLKIYDEAFQHSQQLKVLSYPSEIESLSISLQCAMAAKEYEIAQQDCQVYQRLPKPDEEVLALCETL